MMYVNIDYTWWTIIPSSSGSVVELNTEHHHVPPVVSWQTENPLHLKQFGIWQPNYQKESWSTALVELLRSEDKSCAWMVREREEKLILKKVGLWKVWESWACGYVVLWWWMYYKKSLRGIFRARLVKCYLIHLYLKEKYLDFCWIIKQFF